MTVERLRIIRFTRLLHRTFHNLSILDYCLLGFLIYFNIRLFIAPLSVDAEIARPVFLSTLVLYVLSIFLSRGEILSHPRARGITHRSVLLFSILGLYLLAMREALAALQPTLMDAQLANIDRSIFGYVPAQALESIHHPLVTEWFAFFYYNYFFIIGLSVLPSAFFGRSTLARGIVQGAGMIVCIGHILYTLVPGRGPYVALEFASELKGGFFWELVKQAVVSQGALLDIFPSLHTALPSFLVMYLAANRTLWPFRIPWTIAWVSLLFATINIIIATLYLRWHYAIDVIAGLILAGVTTWIVMRTNPDDDVRQSRSKQAVFEPCFGGLWSFTDLKKDKEDMYPQ